MEKEINEKKNVQDIATSSATQEQVLKEEEKVCEVMFKHEHECFIRFKT